MSRRITLNKFLSLPDREQFDVIFTLGDFLEIRQQENRRFVLYSVEQFFVELEYDMKIKKIIQKKAFVSGEILNKYSANINTGI